MNVQLACCGISCESCPIHLATLEPDKSRQHSMRISIAKECSEHHGMNLSPGEINDCDGCRADTGRIFSGCLDCRIRKCAIHKGLITCASCNEYACDMLMSVFELDPQAKERLDLIRSS